MEVLTLQAPSKWGGQILHRTGSTVPRLQWSQCGHAMSPHCCAPICMRHDVLIHSSILGQHWHRSPDRPPPSETAQSLPGHITALPLAAFSFFSALFIYPSCFQSSKRQRGEKCCWVPLEALPSAPLQSGTEPQGQALTASCPPGDTEVCPSTTRSCGAGGGDDLVRAGGQLKPYPCLQVEDQLHLPASPREPDSP